MNTINPDPVAKLAHFLDERARRTRSVPLVVSSENPLEARLVALRAINDRDQSKQHWIELDETNSLISELQTRFPIAAKFTPEVINCWFHPSRADEIIVIANADSLSEDDIEVLWRSLYRAQAQGPAVILAGGTQLAQALSQSGRFTPGYDFPVLQV